MKTWMKWALAGVVALLATAAAVFLRDKTWMKMALADFKRAGAEHQNVKVLSENNKRMAAKTQDKSGVHLANANRASAKAHQLQEEAREIAKEVSVGMPDSERARRFNERHGLSSPTS